MRSRSSSEDRRYRQDLQALLGLGILIVVAIVGWMSEGMKPYCWGALCGAVAPMFILMLRYVIRLVGSFKMDVLCIANTIGYVVGLLSICIVVFPFHMWHCFTVVLLFVATVFGWQKFKLTQLFMLLNCMIAGAILL